LGVKRYMDIKILFTTLLRNHNILTLILSATLLVACSDNKEAKTEKIFQHQVDSLNKAKGLEKTLLDADQRRRQAIDEQSR